MKKTLKKRGQKFFRKISKTSTKVEQNGRDHIRKNLIEKLASIHKIRLLILEWGLLVSMVFCLALAQAFWFGKSYAQNGYTSGGTYTEATLGEVNSLNPLFATTNSEKVLSRLLFATISEVDYSGHPGIGLAKSINSSENGKIWTVKLRDNLKWSDGEPITNADVIFTISLIKNPLVSSIYDSNFTNVKINESEDGTLVFTLPSAYADFVSALNIPVLPEHILKDADPKTLAENSFSVAPVTSGAFTFNATQSSKNLDEKIFYLSANKNYYKGAPLLSGFAVHTYNTKEEIVAAVNSGAITATAELSANAFGGTYPKNFTQKTSSLNSGAFLFFNTAREYLGQASTRQTIREGIDVGAIRAALGDVVALDYPLVQSQIPEVNYPEIPVTNVSRAKQKLAEIFDRELPTLNLATVNSGSLPEAAEQIASALRELGFTVEVSKYEENQDFINTVIAQRNYDILVYETELGADLDLLPYYHSSQATSSGLNLSNYRNSIVDDLLLGARDTTDDSLRAKKYSGFLEYWVNDVPAIGLYRGSLTYYCNRNAQTYGDNLHLATALDRFGDIDSWATIKATKSKTP